MRHLTIAIGLLVGAAWACGDSPFVCASDEHCARGDVGGVCQATGFCSFPDDACASGQRYGEHAGKGLAGACVSESEDDDAAGTSGGDMTSSAADTFETTGSETSGDPQVTTTSTTSDVDETSTTGSYDTSEGGQESAERTTGSLEPCAYEEDFESRTVPDAWNVGGQLEVVVLDGMLGMELMSSQTSKYGWAWTDPMDLNGRTVMAEVGSPPPASSDAQLMLELTTQTLGFFMLVEGSHLLARTSDGAGHTTHASIAFHPVDTRFVSISHMAGTVRFAYSDDGFTWTTLHDLPIDISFSSTNLAVVGGTWKYESNVGFVGFDSISVCP